MELRKRLETDLYKALRENNEVAKNTIRIVLSSLKLAEVEKGHAFDDPEIQGVIQKELKMRSESIEEFTRGSRLDLVEKTRQEAAILENYLPAQLSDAELLSLIDSQITALSAKQASDMGKVMKAVLPLVQGRAPSDRVSKLVKSRLSQE
jgi:uncharacterized protein YqeY